MKSLLRGFFILVVFSTPVFAQQKAVQKAVIQTPGVRDELCKTKIDNFLVHEYGVSSVKADFRRHTVTVAWYTDRTNIENIKTALANMGYDADDIKANPESYNKLPPQCRPVKKDSIK